VIVDDLHIVGVSVVPDEADAVLIVDPNTVLAMSIARERLESVARERRQISKFASGMELLELSLSHSCHFLQAPAKLAFEERLGFESGASLPPRRLRSHLS
jgi:hypothetical protein